MRKKFILSGLGIVLMMCLAPVLTACGADVPVQGEVVLPSLENWTPPEPVSGDSVLLLPSSPSYVGNTSSQNPNNYPYVKIAQATLTKEDTQAHISYRQVIESPNNEKRYNIITLFLTGKNLNTSDPQNSVAAISIYTVSVPEGLVISDAIQWTGSLSSGSILQYEIPESLPAGKYKYEIGFIINGIDFGTLPCTLTITK
jgi:hypothetical protein